MRRAPDRRGERAFTLVETMVGGVIAGFLLAAVVMAGAVCQRIYAASDGALKASADQSRILDYVVRDLRQALTVNVSNGGQTLTLTVPDYLDPGTGAPRIPTVTPPASSTAKGVVDYGAPTAPVTITYSIAAGKYLLRHTGSQQTVISRDCDTLEILFADHGDSVTTSISYAPRFNLLNLPGARAATTASARTALRNPRRT